jgi:hypothetical protein
VVEIEHYYDGMFPIVCWIGAIALTIEGKW